MFRSIVELQPAINRFLRETNDDPKPFTWTADPDKNHRRKRVNLAERVDKQIYARRSARCQAKRKGGAALTTAVGTKRSDRNDQP
jgi:hypothetical protein